jgi:3-methylcrotonyl-CoA carboxylase alpha subunit
MRKMASKSEAKKIMEAAGVPILKGYHGENQDPAHLLAEAKNIGFPVMLKASMGGGGKGMRIAETEVEFME